MDATKSLPRTFGAGLVGSFTSFLAVAASGLFVGVCSAPVSEGISGMYPTEVPWNLACAQQLRCSPVPPAVRAIDRSIAIGSSELYVLDVGQLFTCYAYELAVARSIVAAGRCHRGQVRAGGGFKNLGPFRRDLCGDMREVRFE